MVSKRKKITIETTVCEENPVYLILKYLEENQINLRDAICAGLTTHYATLSLAYFDRPYQEVKKFSSNSISRLNAINQTALSLSLYGQIEEIEASTDLEKAIAVEETTFTPAVSLNIKSNKKQELHSCNDDTFNLDLD